jgi:lipopolysaccharide transport system permease protein
MTVFLRPAVDNLKASSMIGQQFQSPSVSASTLRIQPSRAWSDFSVAELWRYRELIYFLSWRDVKVRYKQTFIGVVWVLLQPLAMMAIFWFIFGRIIHMPSADDPYHLYVLSGLVPWQFFSRVISESTNSLITDQRLITRVYFPRLVVPIATALTAFVDFSLAMCLVSLLMIWFDIIPGAAIVFFPVAILLMLTAALGVGFWLSALNVEYRDVMHAIPFLVQFWFFITPVVYAASSIPGSWRWLFAFNPMIAVVDAFRWCLLGAVPVDTQIPVVSAAIALASFFTGMLWFRWRERRFVDALGSGGA